MKKIFWFEVWWGVSFGLLFITISIFIFYSFFFTQFSVDQQELDTLASCPAGKGAIVISPGGVWDCVVLYQPIKTEK